MLMNDLAISVRACESLSFRIGRLGVAVGVT